MYCWRGGGDQKMGDTNNLLITNVCVCEPGRGVVGGAILVEGDRVRALDPANAPGAVVIDGGGRLLTPGLIDQHTHGIESFVFERNPMEMREGLRRLARYGVTGCLPTLYRVMTPESLDRLAELSVAIEGDPVAAGLHLEGPFLALPGAGAATMAGEIGFLKELLAAAGDRIAAMSVSPETPGIIPVIEHLSSQDIAVFLTHTRASVDQTDRAIAAGARHATHFYDVFPLPDQTEPGVRPVGAVEAILADRRVSVDFIPDGVHVHPAAIRAAVAAKGWEGVIAITDANVGAGLADGVYDTAWGYPVRIRGGDAARIHRPGKADDGLLAGSTLTMNRAVDHLRNWLTDLVSDAQIWAMATSNPARLLGMRDRGSLLPGSLADLVLWDEAGGRLNAERTWVRGRCVFE